MYTLLTQSGTLVQFINSAVHSIHTELVPETFDLYYNVSSTEQDVQNQWPSYS